MKPPKHIHVNKEKGLDVEWHDGSITFYPNEYLRHHSPSAEMTELRNEMKDNPLAVIPKELTRPPKITKIEPVGLYAIRIHFSDGHKTGIYSWEYLLNIKPTT